MGLLSWLPVWQAGGIAAAGVGLAVYLFFFAGRYATVEAMRAARAAVLARPERPFRNLPEDSSFGAHVLNVRTSPGAKNSLAALVDRFGWDLLFSVATPCELRHKFTAELRHAAAPASKSSSSLRWVPARLFASGVSQHVRLLQGRGVFSQTEGDRLSAVISEMDDADAQASASITRAHNELERRKQTIALAKEARISAARNVFESSGPVRALREADVHYKEAVEHARRKRDKEAAKRTDEDDNQPSEERTRKILARFDRRVRKAEQQRAQARSEVERSLEHAEADRTAAILAAERRYLHDLADAKNDIAYDETLRKAERERALRQTKAAKELDDLGTALAKANFKCVDYVIPPGAPFDIPPPRRNTRNM